MPGKEPLEKYMLGFDLERGHLIVAEYVEGQGAVPINVISGPEAWALYTKLTKKELKG